MEEIIKTLKVLSNKIRLQTFLILCQENLCVCELKEILNIEQSRLSHQLRLLRYAGLVDTVQQGKRIIYFVPEKIKKDKFMRDLQETVKLKLPLKKRLSMVRKNRTWNKK